MLRIDRDPPYLRLIVTLLTVGIRIEPSPFGEDSTARGRWRECVAELAAIPHRKL